MFSLEVLGFPRQDAPCWCPRWTSLLSSSSLVWGWLSSSPARGRRVPRWSSWPGGPGASTGPWPAPGGSRRWSPCIWAAAARRWRETCRWQRHGWVRFCSKWNQQQNPVILVETAPTRDRDIIKTESVDMETRPRLYISKKISTKQEKKWAGFFLKFKS